LLSTPQSPLLSTSRSASQATGKPTQPRVRKAHSVYHFFKATDDPDVFICKFQAVGKKHISEVISRGGVSNLVKHLELHHREASNKYKMLGVKYPLASSVEAIIAAADSEAKQATLQRQATSVLQPMLNQELHREFAVLLFAVENAVSFNCLESASWNYCCEVLGGGSLCAGQTLLRKRLSVAHKVALQLSVELFASALVVSVIIDTATIASKDSLLSISYRYVENLGSQLFIHTKTLDFVDVTWESKTGEFIKKEVATKTNLRLGANTDVAAYVSDGAANMERALFTLGDTNWLWCLSHRLALVLKETGKIELVRADFLKVQTLVTSVKNSEVNKKLLREAQAFLGLRILSLKLDIKTRWGSKYHQIVRLLECKDALIRLRRTNTDFQLLVPDNLSLSRLEGYAKLMEPIVKVLEFAEGDDLTLPAMPKKLHSLVFKQLPEIQTYTNLEPVKKALISSLKKYVAEVYSSVGCPILAALCHPAYGGLGWLPTDSPLREKAWDTFLDEACLAQQTKTAFQRLSREELQATVQRLRCFFDSEEAKKENPLTFWTNSANGLLAFVPVVQKYLSIPPSSAAAERSFSATKFIQSGRPQLKMENLGKVAVVRNFMQQPLYNHQEFIQKLVNAVG